MTRIALAASLAATLAAQQHVAVFLFDRSGSMNTGAIAGACPGAMMTRCQKTEAVAKDGCATTIPPLASDVDKFFSLPGTKQAWVIEFSGGGALGTRIVGSAMTSAATKALIFAGPGGLSPCSGLTPLADALCASITRLRAFPAALSRRLYVYSDGEENYSQIAGPVTPCEGLPALGGEGCPLDYEVAFGGLPPFSAAAGGLPSWQQNTCAEIESIPMIINVRVFGAFVDGIQSTLLASAARRTGGEYFEIPDSVAAADAIATVAGGGGCSGANNVRPYLRLTGTPTVGQGFTVLTSVWPGGVGVGVIGLGELQPHFDLAPLGAPGCKLEVDPLVLVLPPQGIYNWPVPNQSSLVGLSLYYQGAVLDGQQNAFGFVTTNSLRIILQ